MIEKFIIWVIIALSAFFLARRFYRQWRAAFNKNLELSCGQGCCGCAATEQCPTKNEKNSSTLNKVGE